MEQTDLLIVGQGVVALTAAAHAAREGVRTKLIETGAMPEQALYEVPASAAAKLGLDAAGAWPGASIHGALAERAKALGVEVRRARGEPFQLRLEAGGWRALLGGGEPIRARLLGLAESARAPLLTELGIAAAQRFTPSGAELLTWAAASWLLPPSELAKHPASWRRSTRGPLAQLELVRGSDRVTVWTGPVWSAEGPSPEDRATMSAVGRAARALGLPLAPSVLEVEEARLDALACPSCFDGGVVFGAGAGHAAWSPSAGLEQALELGEAAGVGLARAILGGELSSHALTRALEPYRAAFLRALPPAAPVTAPFEGFDRKSA